LRLEGTTGATAADLATSLFRQGEMHSATQPQLPATRQQLTATRPPLSSRDIAVEQSQVIQGSQANSWGLINPECFTPAHFQLEFPELETDELDGQGWLPEDPAKGWQEPGLPNTVHIPPRPPGTPSMTPTAGLHLMQHAIALLQNKQQLPDLPDHQWLDYVKSFLLPLAHFRAGFITTRRQVWQLYFHTFGETAKSAQILRWLQHGLDIIWVPYDVPCQQKHPRYRKKVQLINQLLKETVGDQHVASKLQGTQPQAVHFKNRTSVSMHEEFVDKSIQDLLKQGAIKPWTANEPMTVISGLGVALERTGKKRLILDARYINMFDRYESFSYKNLADVPHYLQQQEYIMLADLKAGYHQIRMHPSTHKFLGIQHKGQVYYLSTYHLDYPLHSELTQS